MLVFTTVKWFADRHDLADRAANHIYLRRRMAGGSGANTARSTCIHDPNPPIQLSGPRQLRQARDTARRVDFLCRLRIFHQNSSRDVLADRRLNDFPPSSSVWIQLPTARSPGHQLRTGAYPQLTWTVPPGIRRTQYPPLLRPRTYHDPHNHRHTKHRPLAGIDG